MYYTMSMSKIYCSAINRRCMTKAHARSFLGSSQPLSIESMDWSASRQLPRINTWTIDQTRFPMLVVPSAWTSGSHDRSFCLKVDHTAPNYSHRQPITTFITRCIKLNSQVEKYHRPWYVWNIWSLHLKDHICHFSHPTFLRPHSSIVSPIQNLPDLFVLSQNTHTETPSCVCIMPKIRPPIFICCQ